MTTTTPAADGKPGRRRSAGGPIRITPEELAVRTPAHVTAQAGAAAPARTLEQAPEIQLLKLLARRLYPASKAVTAYLRRLAA